MDSLTRENYFQYGTTLDNFAVTSSSLSYLHPMQGGSIEKFIRYITSSNEKKESMSLTRGTLVHSYLEDSESFKITPEVRPSDAICEVIEDVYETIKFMGVTPTELENHPAQILLSAQKYQFGVAGKWGTDVIIKKVREKGDAYFKHLIESDGSIMVDSKTKTILYNLMSTFENNEELRKFIENKEGFNDFIVYKELPILFSLQGFQCKSLIDRIEIDHEKKIVLVYDYKTTSSPVGQYMGWQEASHIESDGTVVYIFKQGPFQSYRTYRQLAFYQEAVKAWMIQGGFNPLDYKFGFRIVACETIDPYEVKVYPINVGWLRAGRNEITVCFEKLSHNIDLINPPKQYEY